MTIATEDKFCKWCGEKMLPDGDQDRCVDCCIGERDYPNDTTYICLGAAKCGITKCDHYFTHQMTPGCRAGCFSNSGCMPYWAYKELDDLKAMREASRIGRLQSEQT